MCLAWRGLTFWERLMERAGAEGTPVFLIGGKPEVLAQTEQSCVASGMLTSWAVRMAISGRKIAVGYMNACATAARKLSLSPWGRRARRF